MKSRIRIALAGKSPVPKYRQIVTSIEQSIQDGDLKRGDRIPSLNEICRDHGLSQDTVLVAYNELKSRGIITSTVGKGYYILNDKVVTKHKVFLLFDKLTAYKETLYDSFKDAIKGKGTEQIFFHYNNPQVFRNLIEVSAGRFTEYIIMPIADEGALESLSLLDQNRIYILDQGRSRFGEQYPGVYQDFERDIRNIFADNADLMNRYAKVVLIIRNQKGHYGEIVNGLRKFCRQHSIEMYVESDVSALKPQTGSAYVVVDDRDLITLVKKAAETRLKLGTDIGIVSYNESPLKEVIDRGITTISTDFALMGRAIAEMVVEGRKLRVDNPFLIIRRRSI